MASLPRQPGNPAPSARVPFADLAPVPGEGGAELEAAIARVVRSGRYILGPELAAFEREFAAACGARHALGVASGLDALALVLRAWDIGPGDEVLVPSNTFVATWIAVSQVGATPVPVEPDETTSLIEASACAPLITARTRAIVPVHLHGQAVDMGPFRALARERGVKLLEDAAQAHGATDGARAAGALGDAAAFSFFPTKPLGALGDGGAVVTDDPVLAARIELLRNYGSRVKYVNEVAGWNSRLDELQAAILRTRLPWLPRWNAQRAALARRYSEAFAALSLGLPRERPASTHAWHLYVVRTPRRDALRDHLDARGIDTLVHYPIPPHRQQAYAGLGIAAGSLPVAERLAVQSLSLPLWAQMPHAAQDRVIEAVRGFFA